VDAFLSGFEAVIGVARATLFGLAVVAGGVCAVEWAVRSNRLNPFSPLARIARRLIGPILKPMERRVIRAGGTPASAPLWTLGTVVIAGIVVLTLLDFTRGQIVHAAVAIDAGASGVARLVIGWTFAVFYIALLVSVLSLLFRLNPYGRFVRWAFVITEPMLKPIRSVLPPIAMIDFSPLIAYVLLRILETLVLRML
jgi:YggT family protein